MSAPVVVLARRQGTTRVVECWPRWEAGVLRVDLGPVVAAMGAEIDASERDWGILVIHGLHDSPCLECPRRLLPLEAT